MGQPACVSWASSLPSTTTVRKSFDDEIRMTPDAIRTLFDKRIERTIEEVIKVDQTNDAVLKDEIDEYVVTQAILKYYNEALEKYVETPNKPHEGIAIWVSGFFGSGKSSF